MKLSQIDAADVARIRQNLTNYTVGKKDPNLDPRKFYAEWTGVLSVNVEELLHLVDRLAAEPAEDLASCGHPRNEDGECDCSSWPERSSSVHDWDAEAAEREQYAGVMAADLADQETFDQSAADYARIETGEL